MNFLVLGLKLVLNTTFNLNETYFSEKNCNLEISRNCQKFAQIEVIGHFLDFASLVFLDFARNDRWTWCLVAFLQFSGPVSQCILVHLLRAINIPCFFNCFCCFCACFRQSKGLSQISVDFYKYILVSSFWEIITILIGQCFLFFFRARKCKVWNIELPATLDSLKAWAYNIEGLLSWKLLL